MAGEARTQSFVIASATVMIGEMNKLYDLNPTANSIGLVKNFACSATPTYIDLTQGVKGAIIASVMTNNQVKATMEVYEYTSQNLAYGLGLDGTTLVAAGATYTVPTALIGSDTTPVSTLTFSAPTDVSASFPTGSWVMLQDLQFPDHVHYAKLSGPATAVAVTGPPASENITLTFTGQALHGGNSFLSGFLLSPVNVVDVGSKDNQPYMAAKVTAVLPNTSAMTILFPKIRVIKGFSVTFSTDKFTDLPFEFQPYDVLPTDPFYTEFVGRGSARMMINT